MREKKRSRTTRSSDDEGKRGSIKQEAGMGTFCSGVLVLFLLFYIPFQRMIRWLSVWGSLVPSTLTGLILFVLVIRRVRRPMPLELGMLLFGSGWAAFTRLLICNLNLPLSDDGSLYWIVVGTGLCIYAVYLDKASEKRFINAMMTGICVLFLILSVLGIYTAVFGDIHALGRLVRFDAEGVEGGAGPLVYISFLGVHRNVAAAYFAVAMGMMLFQLIRWRTMFWKVAALVCVPVFYVAIAIQHCRSIFLASALCLALCVGVFLQEKIAGKPPVVRIVCVTAAVGVCIGVFFSGFSACSDGVAAAAERAEQSQSALLPQEDNVPAIEAPTKAAAEPALERELAAEQETVSAVPGIPPAAGTAPGEEEEVVVSDQRDMLEDASTLTGRVEIWGAIVPSIQENPMIALVGTRDDEMMDYIQRHGPEDQKKHMHNVLFQQLMVAGVPLFLAYLAFLGLLGIKMVKCYFDVSDGAATGNKGYVLLLSTMMVYGFFEPVFSNHTKFISLVFPLIAGFFVKHYPLIQRGEYS